MDFTHLKHTHITLSWFAPRVMEMLVNKTALNAEYHIFPNGKKKWKKVAQ